MSTPRGIRAQIAEDATSLYPEIKAFFEEAMHAKKKTWLTCKHCRRRSEVDIPDWASRNKVVETLLNQGFGRPAADEGEKAQGFVLQRITVRPE